MEENVRDFLVANRMGDYVERLDGVGVTTMASLESFCKLTSADDLEVGFPTHAQLPAAGQTNTSRENLRVY